MKKLGRIIKGIVLFMIIFGVIIVRMLYMDILMLQNLEIEASEHITKKYFKDTTEITLNQNILRYNLNEKEQGIEEHPYVREVIIQRKLPDTLEIKLKEREEYAIIPYNGNYLFMDRELFLLRKSDSYIVGDLPVLREVQVQSADIGNEIITDNNDQLRFSLDAYEALSISDISTDITEYYLVEDQLIVETTEHIDIVLGIDIDLPYTIVATQQVYEDLLNRNQRNVSIISKYKDYIYVEAGTFFEDRRSNEEEEKKHLEESEEEEEPTGDN